MEEPVHILLVDDHQMFMDGLQVLLESHPANFKISQALGGTEAIKAIRKAKPTLVISDISMPEINGLQLTQSIKAHYPEIKILIISMYNDGPMVSDIFQAEAEGYILKNTGKRELFHAIESILDGGTHYSGTVLNQIGKQKDSDKRVEVNWYEKLTKREKEILAHILEEYTTDQIGEKLFISGRTVETHRKHIMEKSGTKTVVGLMKAISPLLINGSLPLQE